MAEYVVGEIDLKADFGENLLLVFSRDGRGARRPLVILIHGLGGRPFATWSSVLESDWMARADREFDVGVVNYASGQRRMKTIDRRSPDEVAIQLSSEIQDLSGRKVVLIGHSMGGLIAKETLRRLYLAKPLPNPHTRTVAGIVTLGTPSTGAGLTFLLRGPARVDRETLRRHSRLQSDVETFLSTHVEEDLHASPSAKMHVPIFAAAAQRDRFVSPMGAHIGSDGLQRTYLPGGHRSMLRKRGATEWLSTAVDQILEPRVRLSAGPGFTAEFNGSGAHPMWEGAYHVALRQFSDEHGSGSISDLPLGSSEQDPDLIVRAFSAHHPAEQIPPVVLEDVNRQDSSPRETALGISPIGTYAKDAVNLLVAEIDRPQRRWFQATEDDEAEIVETFRKFFGWTTGLGRSATGLLPPGRELDDEL